MDFNSVKSAAKNVQAAVPTVNAMSGIFDTARKTSANVTKIATTSIKSRARVQQAAMKAEGRVARAGMAETALNKQVEKRNENFMKNVDHAVKENRKAGILGMFQSAATGAIMGIDRKATEKERAARNAREETSMQKMIEAMKQPGPQFDYSIFDQLNNSLPKPPDPNDPKYTYQPGQQSSTPPGTAPAPSPAAPGGSQNMSFAPPVSSGAGLPDVKGLYGKNWHALQTVIRQVEGTKGDKGYTTRFGGHQFTGFGQHPNIKESTGWGTKSEAAGAFQFMKPTWDESRNALGLTDFSPASQQKAGRFLTNRRGVNPDADLTDFGAFSSAITKLSPEWAGLPSSTKGRKGYWGQANADMNQLHQLYLQTLNQ